MHARGRDSCPPSSSSNSSASPGWPGPSCRALLRHPLFSIILPPGTCSCQLLNPFPAPPLPCPPSQPSPAAQAVVSFPTSLTWVTCRSWGFWVPPIHLCLCLPLLKSIREYGKPGRSWQIVPVAGSSRRPRWGVSKTHWCFGSTGCACWCHCSSGNGSLLCKSPVLLQGVQQF